MKKIYIILSVILLALIIVIIINNMKKKEINSFNFPSTLNVVNHTNNEYADIISKVILESILKIDTITIKIFTLRNYYDNDTYEFKGMLVKNVIADHNYSVFLKDNLSHHEIIEVLSHEFVHLEQMERGDLEIILNEGYIWKGKKYFYKDVKYEDRPYEIEAINKSIKIKRELKKILYK